jgi:membrane-associated phospholipid phosphatase/tRNA A-37 threonylcarbamoyl transferase component Bud32
MGRDALEVPQSTPLPPARAESTGTHGSALGDVGQQRTLRVAGVRLSGRRRRPSGDKPPLPRELGTSGRIWLAAGLCSVLIWAALFAVPTTADWWGRRDLQVLEMMVDIRGPTLTTIMLGLHALGSAWFIRPIRWAAILVLVIYGKWRILAGVLIAFLIEGLVVSSVAQAVHRPRPFVEIIGDWAGYSHPSRPVAELAVTLVVVGLSLIPKGLWRSYWFIVAALVVTLLGLSRMYLGVDHPTDVVIGAVLGPVIGVMVFRIIAPESVFPVSFHRGRSAHLDVTGRRGEAIRRALQEQMGIEVLSLEPFGLAGSGGSTPLKIEVAGDPPRTIFGKLYAQNHLRADSLYKVARTVLYGSLEDEVRFTSVRRLVEYEDYILLKLRDAGLPSPEPYGFVELTPEREYLIVTEFLMNAQEMGEVELTDEITDDALLVVRRLWDAGLAHRDIKPANVMVRDGHVVLIDPAFATVRPSPWRQAVDLANMMIILALRSNPEYVYQRALLLFSPDDIAEAFASTRSVTVPSQSRSFLAALKRQEGTDVIARFRELAPHREPISIQRWSLRRVLLAGGSLIVVILFAALLIVNITGGGFI